MSAGLRPPLKLHLQFSPMQLLRRLNHCGIKRRNQPHQVHKLILTIQRRRRQLLPTAIGRRLFGVQSNIAEQLYSIHTVVVGITNALIEFLHSVTVGTGMVLGIILLIGACIPRRSTVLSEHVSKGPR
jgi:hypothetical protein